MRVDKSKLALLACGRVRGCQSVPKAAPSPSDTTLGYQSEVVPLRADPDFRGATMNNHRFIHFHYPTGSQVLARLIYLGKFSDRMTFVYLLEWEIRRILFAVYIPYVRNSLKAFSFSTKNGELCDGFKQFKKELLKVQRLTL